MPAPRARLIVAPLPGAGGTARLSREEAAHARARRLRSGDPVVLLDGSGRQAQAHLTRLDESGGEVSVERVQSASDPGLPVALSVAGLRAQRLAWLVEKATELSASRVTLVVSARTQIYRASAHALERLDRVAREAAKQCESARWPQVAGPVPLDQALCRDPGAHRLFLDAEGEGFPLSLRARPVVLLVGPEGGWTEEEREVARVRGWSVVALPAGKLRSETAAVAALVLTRAAMGRKT